MQQPSEPLEPTDAFLAPCKSPPDFAEMGKKGWRLRPSVTINCGLCGKERETKLPGVTKWCSNSCNWKARREEGAYDRKLCCIICGVHFVARPNRGKRYRRTCGAECRNFMVGQKNARLDDDAVEIIRKLGSQGKSQRTIARQFGCSQNVVCGILRGRSFKWVPASPAKEEREGRASEGRQGPSAALPTAPQAP